MSNAVLVKVIAIIVSLILSAFFLVLHLYVNYRNKRKDHFSHARKGETVVGYTKKYWFIGSSFLFLVISVSISFSFLF